MHRLWPQETIDYMQRLGAAKIVPRLMTLDNFIGLPGILYYILSSYKLLLVVNVSIFYGNLIRCIVYATLF
jgi:hypothetical protein